MNEWTDGWTDGRHLMPRETVGLATSQRTTDPAMRPNSCQASAGLNRKAGPHAAATRQHCVEKPPRICKKFPTFNGTQKLPPGDQCQLNPCHILTPGFCKILCTSRPSLLLSFLQVCGPSLCVLCMYRLCMSWGSSRPDIHSTPRPDSFSELNNRLGSQQSPGILWTAMVHYRVYNSPPLAPILSEIKPGHALPVLFI